jgi:hypothetical protein
MRMKAGGHRTLLPGLRSKGNLPLTMAGGSALAFAFGFELGLDLCLFYWPLREW